MKKRRLKKWVRATIETVCMVLITFALVLGLMIGMTEAHYQRLEYYQELANK